MNCGWFKLLWPWAALLFFPTNHKIAIFSASHMKRSGSTTWLYQYCLSKTFSSNINYPAAVLPLSTLCADTSILKSHSVKEKNYNCLNFHFLSFLSLLILSARYYAQVILMAALGVLPKSPLDYSKKSLECLSNWRTSCFKYGFNEGRIPCIFIGLLLTAPIYLLNPSEHIMEMRAVRLQMVAGT